MSILQHWLPASQVLCLPSQVQSFTQWTVLRVFFRRTLELRDSHSVLQSSLCCHGLLPGRLGTPYGAVAAQLYAWTPTAPEAGLWVK